MTGLGKVVPANRTSLHRGVAMMMRCLMDGEASVNELVDVSGLSESTVRKWLKAMIECYVIRVVQKIKAYHVEGPGAAVSYLYALNPDYLESAERPRRMTGAQRQKRRRDRKKVELLNSIGRATPWNTPKAT